MMKIRVNDFKSYTGSREFELPNFGLIQLSGISGSGKTTLLQAIFYAFYGKVKNPYTNDTKNRCLVELQYMDMIITRTSRPNRLIVMYKETEYEDDAAQGVIDSVLGVNYGEFQASSYIVQRKNNSVISMTPSEKTKFIETLAFNDEQHSIYKNKIKDHRVESKEIVTRSEGSLSLLESQFLEYKSNIQEVILPEDVNPDTIHKEESKLKKKLKVEKGKLETANEQLSKLLKEEDDNSSFIEEKTKLEIIISQLEQKLSSLPKYISDDDLEALRDKLKDINKNIKDTDTYNEYEKSLKLYNKLMNEHESSIKFRVKALKKNIPSEKAIKKLQLLEDELTKKTIEYGKQLSIYENLEENKIKSVALANEILEKSKHIYKTRLTCVTESKDTRYMIHKFTRKLSEYEKSYDISQSKLLDLDKQKNKGVMHKCPSCKAKLQFDDNKLKVVGKNNTISPEECEKLISEEDMISISLSSKIKKFKRWLAELNELNKVLEMDTHELSPLDVSKEQQAADRLAEITRDVSELEDIVKAKLPKSIIDLENECSSLKDLFPKDFKPYTSKDIKKRIKEAKKLEIKVENAFLNNGEYDSINRDLGIHRNRLKYINKQLGHTRKLKSKNITEKIRDAKEIVNVVQQSVIKITNRLSEMNSILEDVRKYKTYKKNLRNLDKLSEKLESARQNHRNLEIEYQAALQLEKLSKDAEILSMEKTVESINEHAKVYLNKMFEDPISVRLCTMKSGAKTSKAQINLLINYKGYNYQSIDEMSGGEIQRCELAFMLAVNDMVSSNILFLDECLNNLNGEINTDTLEYLREFSQNKLTLVISHEAIDGIFDEIVKF